MSDKQGSYRIESYMIGKVGIDYQDRRTEKRGPGRLSDCLICSDDGQVADCTLLDISSRGVKIKIDKESEAAEFVALSLGQQLVIVAFVDVSVEVIWLDGSLVGLRYLGDAQQSAEALKAAFPHCLPFDDTEIELA